jgi:hypothetical protein
MWHDALYIQNAEVEREMRYNVLFGEVSTHLGASIGPVFTQYCYMCLLLKCRVCGIDQTHQVYFLLFMTFVHISLSPVLASLSGKPEIASMALSTYSCARARVC